MAFSLLDCYLCISCCVKLMGLFAKNMLMYKRDINAVGHAHITILSEHRQLQEAISRNYWVPS